MYPFGHIGVGILIGYGIQLINRNRPNTDYLWYVAIFGVLFPDLFDKSMLILGIGSGRWVAHSILGSTIFFILFFIIIRSNIIASYYYNENIIEHSVLISITFVCGMFAHILSDIPISTQVVFWPLYGIFPERNLSNALFEDLTNPFTFISEFIGFIIIAGFVKIRNWKRNYMKAIMAVGSIYVLTLLTALIWL